MTVKSATERSVKNGRPKTSVVTENLVVKLYNEDYPVADICTACKISRSTVYRILRERRQAEANGETQ